MQKESALGSNFLFVDGKVLFTQVTGSLTALDLESGEVRIRKQLPESTSPHGKLQHCPHGILLIGYNSVTLLDEGTFEPRWRIDDCHDATVDGERILSHNGYHTVRCHDLSRGTLCWTTDMNGGWLLKAYGGKALVAACEHEGRSALKLFDLADGRELLSLEAPPGIAWLRVYFDGQFIYVASAPSKADGWADAPTSVAKMDLQGKPISSVEYQSSKVVAAGKNVLLDFYWDEKAFLRTGIVRPSYSREPAHLTEEWSRRDEKRWSEVDSLPEGLMVRTRVHDALGEEGQVVRMSMADGSWISFVSYHLGRRGILEQNDAWKGKLLLGSSRGRVECLDVVTGRPLWLYVFPSIHEIVSYSSPYGLPPYLTQRAAAYRQSVFKLGETCGSVLLTPDFDIKTVKWSELRSASQYPGRIVLDPSPDDPFSGLTGCLAIIIICALLPLVATFCLVVELIRGKELILIRWAGSRPHAKWGPGQMAAYLLFVTFLPVLALISWGRVSYGWTLALKVSFALAVLATVCALVHLFRKKRWIVAAVLTVILVVMIDFVKYAWWYS